MDIPSIQLRDVHFSYDPGLPVLHGLSLNVAKGAIFGLLGPNGAGKSTTFRILVGLDLPDSGEAYINGLPITSHNNNNHQVYRQIGYMPDIGEVFDSSTVEDLLTFFGRAQHLSDHQIQHRADDLIARFYFAPYRTARLSKLSRGLRQQAHIMRCLIHSPSVLILDEPASHLDPVRRQLLLNVLRQEAAAGTTILISSHILPELAHFCTSVAIMRQGRVVDQGRVEELIDKYQNRRSSYQLRTTSHATQAAAYLQREAHSFSISSLRLLSQDTIVFESGADADTVAAMLELLVRSGVKIIEFEKRRKDIEQIYLELMGPVSDE